MKNYNKKLINNTIGAAILPIGMNAIKGEGQLGAATSTVMGAGFLKKTSKDFLG